MIILVNGNTVTVYPTISRMKKVGQYGDRTRDIRVISTTL